VAVGNPTADCGPGRAGGVPPLEEMIAIAGRYQGQAGARAWPGDQTVADPVAWR